MPSSRQNLAAETLLSLPGCYFELNSRAPLVLRSTHHRSLRIEEQSLSDIPASPRVAPNAKVKTKPSGYVALTLRALLIAQLRPSLTQRSD